LIISGKALLNYAERADHRGRLCSSDPKGFRHEPFHTASRRILPQFTILTLPASSSLKLDASGGTIGSTKYLAILRMHESPNATRKPNYSHSYARYEVLLGSQNFLSYALEFFMNLAEIFPIAASPIDRI
jgi:hypothetical protein